MNALPAHLHIHRRLLQIAVAIGGCVPVGAGLAGAVMGIGMIVPVTGPITDLAGLDSHFRYMSGLLLGIGLAFWRTIPRIESETTMFHTLTVIVVIGGSARAYGVVQAGWPDRGMSLALAMELAVTPLLCLAQARLAQACRATGQDQRQ